MTGFFKPEDLGATERAIVRSSIAGAINKILGRTERCCSFPQDISITNVCYYDYTGCINLVLKSRPKDCGDGNEDHWLLLSTEELYYDDDCWFIH